MVLFSTGGQLNKKLSFLGNSVAY